MSEHLKSKTSLFTILTMLIIGITMMATPGFSADYPAKPISVMVGFSPGGGVDTFARSLASFMHEPLGMPMMIVNKPGAASMIAAKFTLARPADGYTLFVTNGGTLIAKALMDGAKSPVDPLKDFVPLGTIGQMITALVVPKDSPYKSAADLIKAAKEKPGKLRWAHPGRGALHMLAGAAFLSLNKAEAKDIPFKGGAKARNAIVGKQVDFGFVGVQLLAGFESKVKALGVCSGTRDVLRKNVPTFEEQGLEAMDIAGPIMVFGHKDLPAQVKSVLVPAIKEVVQGKNYAKLIQKAGITALYRDPKTSQAKQQSLYDVLSPIVKKVMGAK